MNQLSTTSQNIQRTVSEAITNFFQKQKPSVKKLWLPCQHNHLSHPPAPKLRQEKGKRQNSDLMTIIETQLNTW